ncbi:MAG: sensor histidine kinase [Marinoscillum sp.]
MSNKSASKYFLVAFVPSVLVILVIAYFVHQNTKKSILESTINYKNEILNLKTEYVQDFYLQRLEDLFLISNLENLKKLGTDSEISESVQHDFITVAQATNYYQVRWLDTTGQEQLRIDFKDQKTEVIPREKLQNKAKRDYFKSAQELELNAIYSSPVDLNMEFGKIESPLEPVIRLIKPTYTDQGIKTGFLVLNIRMGSFLNKLKGIKTSEDPFDFSLLNQTGHWLTSTAGKPTFGFMIDSLKDKGFANNYPEEWKVIQSKQMGSLLTDKGLFVYRRFCPEEVIETFNGTHNTNLSSAKCNDLYFVGRLPDEVLHARLNSHRPIVAIVGLAFILMVLSVVITISKLKEQRSAKHLILINRQLTAKEKILETRNAQLESFVRVASHDLREPLGTIKGVATTLESDLANEDNKIKRGVTFIKNCAIRMDNLTKAILEYARTGKNSVLGRIDCMDLVQSIENDLLESIRATNTTINYRRLPEIIGFEAELRQLFQNIISNAIRYKKPDIDPVIDIVYENGEQHIFHITDNGIGIDKSHHLHIFKLFNRASTIEDGLGIGLGMAKKIVELHEGEIWLTSKLNDGSTFSFTLSKHLGVDTEVSFT